LVCFLLFLGTIYAFNQNRIKRLIIYSSIAQTGFLVSVLSVQTIESISSLYFFIIIYLVTSLLIWGHFIMFNNSNAIISNFNSQPLKPLYITDFTNFFNINAVWSFSMLICFFSIAGIPPLAGFLSKMLVVLELVSADQVLAASLLIVISALSVYYYIRLIKISYFESNKSTKTKPMQVIFTSTSQNLEYVFFFYWFIFLNFFISFSNTTFISL